MPNKQKKFIVIVLFSVVVLSISSFYLSNLKSGFAQTGIFTKCDEKIPIGETIEATGNILDDIYVALQIAYQEITFEINTANEILDKLGKDAKDCDLSVCKPTCYDMGPGLNLKLYLGPIPIGRYPACVAVCENDFIGKETPCQGVPCPDIEIPEELLKESREKLVETQTKIVNILEGLEPELVRVTEDIAYPWENEETKISKIEFARRKLARARSDFDKHRMTEQDWLAYGEDRLIAEATARCSEVLREEFYWPSLWPEDCKEKCEENPYDMGCQKCLCGSGILSTIFDCYKKCENRGASKCQECINGNTVLQFSWRKAVSCKFFVGCENECKGGLTKNCQECMCTGVEMPEKAREICEKTKSTDECNRIACQDWLCGGNLLNWAFCH